MQKKLEYPPWALHLSTKENIENGKVEPPMTKLFWICACSGRVFDYRGVAGSIKPHRSHSIGNSIKTVICILINTRFIV